PAPLAPAPLAPAPLAPAQAFESAWGHVRATLTAPAAGVLVVSEAWAPGWEARVNGGAWRPTERANHLFQGLRVPAGELRVELRYRPRAARVGLWLAAAAALAAAALWRWGGGAAGAGRAR
ncbi:MAG: YfhO family protein, partial [Deltaproteobacteria bacterium]|nr:YfhO family protein [Deltaproteobacteria bacterium]